jgi:hypothetical protein
LRDQSKIRTAGLALAGEKRRPHPARPVYTKAGVDEVGINVKSLMGLVHGLSPSLRRVHRAIAVYIDIRAALTSYLATQSWFTEARERDGALPTIGTMRASLTRLDNALTELQAAWAIADKRSMHMVYVAAGEPDFDDSEMRPRVAMPERWDRGAYRAVKFQESVQQIAVTVAAVRREVEAAKQDRRQPVPGLDELTARLAQIFTKHSKSPVSYSRKSKSALAFIQQVIETLPARYTVSPDTVDKSLRRYMRAGEKAKARRR